MTYYPSKIIKGKYRRLTVQEKQLYPSYKYVITQPYILFLDNSKVLTVPRGFLTDGSSRGPDLGTSWIFHDKLYANHQFDDGSMCLRATADRIMRDILQLEGYTLYSYAYLAALFIFRRRFRHAWRSSGRRGEEYLTEKDMKIEYQQSIING